MQVHDLEQGSPEWHEHRRTHWNASDAPVMMGVSKYKTRSEFLHELHTGIAPEVDSHTQRRFDEGHRFEALARSLAEEIVGESLYPVTGTEGRHSASFDGLTMLENVAYEHKRLNDAIRAAQTVSDLDAMYHIQMEQQCLVSGAEKVLFLASNWDDQGNLLEEKHFWYEPDMELRGRIIQGWEQLEKDRVAYVPFEIDEPAKVAAPKDLPVVSIQVRGELTTSNLDEVTPQFDRFLNQARTYLKTDDDFATAEAESKVGRETAKRCKLTAKAVIDQILPVSEVVRTLEEYAAKFDALALRQEKAVREQKDARKTAAKTERDQAYDNHIKSINAELSPISIVVTRQDQPDFIGVMKNQKTLKSIYNNLDTELANAKIRADAIAKDIRAKLAWHKENAAGYGFLFSDMQQIVFKEVDDFQMLVQNRIAQHKANEAKKLEAERALIQINEEAKARAKVEAEARAKAAVEAHDKALAERNARIEADRIAKDAETQATPVAESRKPTLVNSAPSKDSALVALARHDLAFFRKKYTHIKELARVMEEIDSFLAATSPADKREEVTA